MDRIELDASQLMHQAASTAQSYLAQAIEDIDTKFGHGYAEKNSNLIGFYMLTAALDFNTCFSSAIAQDKQTLLNKQIHAVDKIADCIDTLATSIESLGE